MAGYGNRTAPDYIAEDMADQHTSTRLGLHDSHGAYSDAHPRYGSGATGGAGFGTVVPFYTTPCPSFVFYYTTYSVSTLSFPPYIDITEVECADYVCVQGNKSDPSTMPSSNDEFRFDKHADTAPYSGAKESRAGSGSTGGAGYGNKTGEFGKGSGGTLYTRSLFTCNFTYGLA
jgi:hypothetical protein